MAEKKHGGVVGTILDLSLWVMAAIVVVYFLLR